MRFFGSSTNTFFTGPMGTANTGMLITYEVRRHRGPHHAPPLASSFAEAQCQDTELFWDKEQQVFGLLVTGMILSQANSQAQS